MAHQVRLTLPDRVYRKLSHRAKQERKPVRKVAEESLCVATFQEERLPASLEAELCALAEKSDDELWKIAESRMPPGKSRRLTRIVNKHEFGDGLTPQEQWDWERLVDESDRLALLKAEAYVILKRRGHRIPTLEE